MKFDCVESYCRECFYFVVKRKVSNYQSLTLWLTSDSFILLEWLIEVDFCFSTIFVTFCVNFHFCGSYYYVFIILLSRTKPNYMIFCGFLFCVILVKFLISMSFRHLVMHKLESLIAWRIYINLIVFFYPWVIVSNLVIK